MTSACTPQEFLVLAQELAQRDNEEICLRTAVNRAYYSLFLTVRDQCQIPGTKKKKHTEVIAYVKKVNYAAGSKLDAVFKARKMADYVLSPSQGLSFWKNEWHKIELLARDIKPKLAKLHP